MMNCKTFKTPTLLGMGPKVSQWWGRVAGISSFQIFFENNRSIVFLTIGLLFIQLKFFCHIYVCRKPWFPKKEVRRMLLSTLKLLEFCCLNAVVKDYHLPISLYIQVGRYYMKKIGTTNAWLHKISSKMWNTT